MSPLPPEVVEHLRAGDLILTDHPRYGRIVFWCHHWPHPEEEEPDGHE